MYIVDVDSQQRESEAIRRLLSSPFHAWLLAPLGIGSLSWIVMEAKKPALVPGIVGDVDILAGPLEFREPGAFHAALSQIRHIHADYNSELQEYLAAKKVAEDGGIKWPPQARYVVGVEVKCGYFNVKPRSTKSSPNKVAGIRKQIEWLLRMGLDRAALLDVIANPPSAGAESSAWTAAAALSHKSLQATRPVLDKRLPDDSPAGHFVWAVGSVIGGDESMRGAGAIIQIRQAVRNPALDSNDETVLNNRMVLLKRIPHFLSNLSVPRHFPIILIDCPKCKTVHYLSVGTCG
jgi:hypothetical protein